MQKVNVAKLINVGRQGRRPRQREHTEVNGVCSLSQSVERNGRKQKKRLAENRILSLFKYSMRTTTSTGWGLSGICGVALCSIPGATSTSYFHLEFSCLCYDLVEPKEMACGVEKQNLSFCRCAGFSLIASFLCNELCSPAQSGANVLGRCDK